MCAKFSKGIALRVPLWACGIAVVSFVLLWSFLSWQIHCPLQTLSGWEQIQLSPYKGKPIALEMVAAIYNAEVRGASHGRYPEIIKISAEPAKIINAVPDGTLTTFVREMTNTYRVFEDYLLKRGAQGFETMPFTSAAPSDRLPARALFLELMHAGLGYEQNTNGVKLFRAPRSLEVRAYLVGEKLKVYLSHLEKSELHVDVDPMVSAFIHSTECNRGSFLVPQKNSEFIGEFHYDKVYKYLPDQSHLLFIATSEDHRLAEANLKKKGLWESEGATPDRVSLKPPEQTDNSKK